MDRDFLFASLPHLKVHLLSRKELEVLMLVTSGMNSKEIAVKLGILPKSIDNYKNRISEKLGLHGYGSLCRFAAENRDTLLQWLGVLLLPVPTDKSLWISEVNKLFKSDGASISGE